MVLPANKHENYERTCSLSLTPG